MMTCTIVVITLLLTVTQTSAFYTNCSITKCSNTRKNYCGTVDVSYTFENGTMISDRIYSPGVAHRSAKIMRCWIVEDIEREYLRNHSRSHDLPQYGTIIRRDPMMISGYDNSKGITIIMSIMVIVLLSLVCSKK